MAPNPYVKAVTGSAPKVKKDKPTPAKKSVKFDAAAATASPDQDALRAEILALGGDEEDLKILRDVDSDSEVEGEVEEDSKKTKGASSKVDVSLWQLSAACHSLLKTGLTYSTTVCPVKGPTFAVQVARLCVRWRSCACRFGRRAGGRDR